MENPWPSLQNGDIERGLEIQRANYLSQPNPSNTMELGIAYLFSKKYVDAYEHFQNAKKSRAATMSAFYGKAGVAKWCLNERRSAIAEWRAGLVTDFADGAGGIQNPLLLFTASIIDPPLISRQEAETILRERIEDPRAKNWPGPVAKFVLGEGKGGALPGLMEGVHPKDTAFRIWKVQFYKGILELSDGNHLAFGQTMRAISDLENIGEESLLSRIWSEEFFIARHASSRHSNSSPPVSNSK